MEKFTRALNNGILSNDALATKLHDAVAEALGDASDCMRVWSAWDVGTMGPDDFVLVAEDSDRVMSLVAAVTKVLLENLPKIAPRIYIPQFLDADTGDLVLRFASAAAEKLYKSQLKFGHTNNWVEDDWLDDCREKLQEAVSKGDPLDVAIYSMFLWHHNETTSIENTAPQVKIEPTIKDTDTSAMTADLQLHNTPWAYFADQLDNVDASIFSGDVLHSQAGRIALRSHLARWDRELTTYEEDYANGHNV